MKRYRRGGVLWPARGGNATPAGILFSDAPSAAESHF